MGFGDGWFWHRAFGFKFPQFPIITKTVTLNRKIGLPFAVIRFGDTVINRISHHNPGLKVFIARYLRSDLIVSVAGTDDEIEEMVSILDDYDISGIQLSFSCPNVCDLNNKRIPKSRHKIYLKLNHTQDPQKYDLSSICAITVNTVPSRLGAISGKYAQKYNWPFIKRLIAEGVDVVGGSFITIDDVSYLEEYCGCQTVGIGSVMLVNPSLIQALQPV
jgi:hypothetical protein